jgi:hypothetical protein
VQRLGLKATKDTKVRSFKTGAGKFKTTHKVGLRKHRILSLNNKRILQGLFAKVTTGDLGRYDIIFGIPYMTKYGLNLLFDSN